MATRTETSTTHGEGRRPTASAQDDYVGARTYSWAAQAQTQYVPVDDPWGVWGWTNYEVKTQPVCWMYAHRPYRIVAEAWVTAPHRFPTVEFDLRSILLPTLETEIVDWTNTTTGERGRNVFHGMNGSTVAAALSGPGVIEMDIHIRTDNPVLAAVGSADLWFGHSEGSVHARVDLPGGDCF